MGLETSVEEMYRCRQDFLLIGLTGRTGSGCTTSSEILGMNKSDFKNKMGFLSNRPISTLEDRKARIVYNFLEEKWPQFTIIEVKNIIASFLLENTWDNFSEWVSHVDSKINLSDEFKIEYNKVRGENIPVSLTEGSCELYDWFYAQETKAFVSSLKKELDSHSSYIKFFQIMGDNIRKSGSAISMEKGGRAQTDPKKMYSLSNRINCIVKSISMHNKSMGIASLIVIDAIRNPIEALFFKERFSAFYLMSVNTEDVDRISRLGLDDRTRVEMDQKEYPESISDEEYFIAQNIQKCIEIADIHLHNPGMEVASNREKDCNLLKEQLAKFISLILHPGLITPTKVERCMNVAYGAKLNSGCISRQVGAVVTNEQYAIKAVGWNNTPSGQVPCQLRGKQDLLQKSDPEAFSDYEKSDKEFRNIVEATFGQEKNKRGLNESFCFKDCQNLKKSGNNQVFLRSTHAEENAFLELAKSGGPGIKGGVLFSTASPCELCAKKAFQLGLKKVYYIDPYPGIAKDQMLMTGPESNRIEVMLFRGAVGRAFHQLYEPIIAHKDELRILGVTKAKKEIKKQLNQGKATPKLDEILKEEKAKQSLESFLVTEAGKDVLANLMKGEE